MAEVKDYKDLTSEEVQASLDDKVKGLINEINELNDGDDKNDSIDSGVIVGNEMNNQLKNSLLKADINVLNVLIDELNKPEIINKQGVRGLLDNLINIRNQRQNPDNNIDNDLNTTETPTEMEVPTEVPNEVESMSENNDVGYIKGVGKFVGGKFVFDKNAEKTDKNGKNFIEYNGDTYSKYELGLNGKGYKLMNGMFYIGDFNYSSIDGLGTMLTSNGDKFSGEWKGGKLNGKGIFDGADKTHYEGTRKEGLKDGEGHITWGNGAEYSGEWREGKMHGVDCKYIGTDGSIYEGEMVNGLRDGSGTQTWPDGSKFRGEWKGGLPNGKGTMLRNDGTISYGIWENGEIKEDLGKPLSNEELYNNIVNMLNSGDFSNLDNVAKYQLDDFFDYLSHPDHENEFNNLYGEVKNNIDKLYMSGNVYILEKFKEIRSKKMLNDNEN